jgi:RND superfamily putative drug exporter
MGRAVTRHHRKIIVIWVLIFLALIWFAPLASQAVVYEDNSGSGRESLESSLAEKWIEERFGQVTDQGSVVVVLAAPTVTNGNVRNAVIAMERSLEGMALISSDGSNVSVRVTSIFSLAEIYAEAYLTQIYDGYPSAYGLANDTRYTVFGIPLSFWSLYNDTVDIQTVEFGIPASYLVNWNMANATSPSASTGWKDGNAYNATVVSVDGILANSTTMDPNERQAASTFLGAFAAAWNATAHDTGMVSSPSKRSESAMDNGFAAWMHTDAFLRLPLQERSLSVSVKANFTLDNFGEMPLTDRFVEVQFEKELEQMISSWSQPQKELARGYFALFYTGWSSFHSAPDTEQFRSLVTSDVKVTARQLPADLGGMMVSLYNTLGWEGWQDSSSLTAFTTDLVAERAGSRPWVVREVISYGDDPGPRIASLAQTMVRNSTLDDFPILLAPALVREFVDVPANDTMLLSLTLTDENGISVSGMPYVAALRDLVSQGTNGTGITAYVTGTDAISSDIRTSMDQDLARIDPVTILLVIVLIGIFFRSFVSSSIPPMVIGMALGISFSAVYFIGTYVLAVNYNVLTLLITSMLGAGCDYCIFILSRYREERSRGEDKVKAIETSVTWAGEAIAISGATVIIGFGMLSVGRLDVLRSMGTLAIGIAVALLMSLTLLPAIIMQLGDSVFWPSKIGSIRVVRSSHGYFTRSARFSIRHARAIVIAALLISVPATYVVLTLNTSYDYISSMPDSQSKQGLGVLADGFGGGKVIPTYLGVGLSGKIFNSTGGYDIAGLDAVENLSGELASLPNVMSVIGPTRPYGETIDYRHVSGNASLEAILNDQYMRTMVGSDDRSVLLTVTFVDGPFSSASVDSIGSMRQIGERIDSASPEIDGIHVSGGTASTFDVSVMTQQDFGWIAVLVIAGIFLVLMFVLRSVISPLRSLVTILVSIAWTLSVTMLLFQYLMGASVIWIVPMVLLVVCLGLGLDYDILLTTRVREETIRGRSNNDAIVESVEKTGGIITACGFIMASAFGTMMLSQGMLLREFGFALMFAILLDSFIVRIFLVPAVMSLLGRWNWYAPARLKPLTNFRTEPTEGKETSDGPTDQALRK